MSHIILSNNTAVTAMEQSYHSMPSVFSVSVTEAPPIFLIAILMLFALWITVVNALVLACLLMSKHAWKNFVNIQILSFCVSDMIVGILAIPLTLTFQIKTAFPYVGACASIFYAYQTAQTANLFHAFGICVFRLITIKRRSGTNLTQRKRFKHLLCQILLTWIGSAFLVACPYVAFAQFGETLQKECSFYVIFGNDFLIPLAFINGIFLIPQVGMSIVYVYMFRFLLTTWRRINTTIGQSTSPTAPVTSSSNCGRPLDSKSLSERGTTKQYNADETQIKDLTTTSQMENLANQEIYKITDTSVKSSYMDKMDNVVGLKNPNPAEYENKSTPHHTATFCASDINRPGNNKTSHLRRNRKTKHAKIDDNIGYRDQKDVLITIGMIVLAMNIFMTPLNFAIFAELFNENLLSRKTRFVLLALSLLNSALNPFIYALRIKPFTMAFKSNFNRVASRVCVCLNRDH